MCYANDATYRTDFGYITAFASFPIVMFTIGDADDVSEIGKLTLGQLECLTGECFYRYCGLKMNKAG